jgi:hypothetical protein
MLQIKIAELKNIVTIFAIYFHKYIFFKHNKDVVYCNPKEQEIKKS